MQTSIIVGIVLATAHLALIAYVVWLIHFANEPDWPMYWLLPLYVDFPASLLYIGVAYLRPLPYLSPDAFPRPAQDARDQRHDEPGTERLHALDVHNFIIPFVFLGMGGTAWWFYLPQGIMWVWYRITG